MPAPLPHLGFLRLSANKLTSLVLPPGMTNLGAVFLNDNQLTNVTLASGLTNLAQLDLRGNHLTSLTLPPDLFRLSALLLDGNPLETLVVSETLAATKLAGLVTTLRVQGVSVLTYPVATQLSSPHRTEAGGFEFTLTGPPRIYTVFSSADLATWSELGTTTNMLGNAVFTDVSATLTSHKFYRARAK
jgi:Leucine-rich repeat (LRR) protein